MIPVDDPRGSGPECDKFETTDPREVDVQSPIEWLSSIETPTFVFEGNDQGNVASLRALPRADCS